MTIFIDNTFVDFSKTSKSKQICFDYQESDDTFEKRMSMEAKKTTKIMLSSSRAKSNYTIVMAKDRILEWKINPSFDRAVDRVQVQRS